MSRQRSDSPVEYPTGIIVCGRHRQAVCGICRVNYSFHNAQVVETNRQKKAKDPEPDNDDDDDGPNDSPIEHPTGIIVCGRHRMAICGICRVNYSFHNAQIVETNRQKKIGEAESNGDDEGEHEDADPYWAKRFSPPTPFDAPKHLYAEGYTPLMLDQTRYVRVDNPQELLIYIDGACVEKGQEAPRAGCAVVFRPEYPGQTSSLSFRLETLNPAGATESDYIDNHRRKSTLGIAPGSELPLQLFSTSLGTLKASNE